MDIATVEEAWAELLRLSGDLVVSRARGAPLGPWSSTRSLARRYRAARRDFDGLLAAAAHAEARPADRAALASIRACLPWLDELEPMPPANQPAGDVQPDPHDAPLRRSVFRRYGRVGAAIRVGGEVVDRLTVFARLAREPDRDARRRLFLALEPLWRAVDGDGDRRSPYRELLGASARRWHETGSPIEANAAALGIDPMSVEAMLRRLLGAWRELLPPEQIEPWDYRYVCGAAARHLDPLISLERLRPIHDAYVASLGADVEALGIGYDLFERPGRPVNSVAFAIGRGPVATGAGSWRARSPWVFATYREGGLGNLSELLHETGHAVHDAAVASRPAFFDFPLEMSAFVEGTADILGFDADEPAWQASWLGHAATPQEALFSRYGSVMLDVCWALFELVLHREPDRRPNDVWAEITADGLGLRPHPEWSWWAVRGQLIELPGYMANYAFSAILAAAVRARLHESIGDWSGGDRRWYPTLVEALFRTGSEVPPADLLRRYIGGPLTAEPLLAELRGADAG